MDIMKERGRDMERIERKEYLDWLISWRDLLSQMFQTMQMVQMLQNINPGNEEDLL